MPLILNSFADIILKEYMLHEVCRNVSIEPALQPLTGENLNRSAITSNEWRVDVSARDFWVRGQQAFFDVRVFNPFAKRHAKKSLLKKRCRTIHVYRRSNKGRLHHLCFQLRLAWLENALLSILG